MKYILVKNNKLVFGPVEWEQYTFQISLLKEGKVVTLPIDAPKDVITFSDESTSLKIYPTEIVGANPLLDEKVSGYELTLEDNIAYYIETVSKLTPNELDQKLTAKRNELKEAVRTKRRTVEQGGITVVVEGVPCVFATDRDSQGMLTRTEQYMTSPVNWKLANGSWITINKSHMTYIVSILNEHIQSCFTKEYTLVETIEKLPLAEAFNFNVEIEWSKL